MSEQINKVLADRPQSFDSAEQAQARDNIGAMAASASSEFAPASAGFSGVSANNYITGDGTSGSPLGLSSRARFENSLSATVIGPNELNVHNHIGTSYVGNSFITLNTVLGGGQTSYMNASSLVFTDSAESSEQVDASSIQRWNSYSAGTPVTTNNCITGDGTTSNPIGLSGHIEFTGASISSDMNASHVIIQGGGTTSWHQRNMFSVEATDYTATHAANKSLYQVTGSAGTQEVDARSIYSWNHPQYYCICPHITGAYSVYLTTSDYPTGLTAAARLDIVPFGDTGGCVNFVGNQSAGATANLYPSADPYDTPWLRSATIWWDPEVQLWMDN